LRISRVKQIPWRVLKSAWRHENPPLCQNCDRPTLLTVFGYFACGFYKRGPEVVRICPLCGSSYEDRSPWGGPEWMLANLDELLGQQPEKTRWIVACDLHRWLEDPDFAGVRGPEALARLPEAERQAWQKLWADIADALSRAVDMLPR
jgi:hypothetical protein